MQATGSLGRRVQQIVQQPLDGAAVRSALEALALSAAAGGPTGDGMAVGRHRDVRAEMQERRQQMDVEFVRALEQVNGAFGAVEDSVARLDGECAALRQQINAALRATARVAGAAGLLIDERRELAARAGLAGGFLQRFSLADSDAAELARGAVGEDGFFAALDRAEQARAECQKLAGASQATAAADLQQELAAQEQAAFTGMLRWVQGEARDLARHDAPEFSGRLKQALARLQPHNALFDAATAEIARTRREALHRAFIAALVRGGPGGTPRPIEAHAADPQRYVGDMLAWAHQACASERELLDTLFSLADSGPAKAHMLAAALESIARPLEIRVQQTVAELAEPTAVYRIDCLLEFYGELFAAVCPPGSLFLVTVAGLAAAARDKLQRCLAALADAAVGDVDTASGGVSPALDVPPSLRTLLSVIADVLRLHSDSIQTTSIGECIVAVLERVHTEMHTAIASQPLLQPYEQTMLELNILGAMHDATAPFVDDLCRWHELCESRDRALGDQLCAQLVEILKAKSHLPFDAEALDADRIATGWARFNQTLKAALDLDLGRITARLRSHITARAAAAHAAQAFVAAYAELHARAAAVAAGSDELLAALHPPETVAALL
ncbi:Golgi transport complex subunit 6 [Coemansia spiralis]|nr:Golgi transport complex subunit 6 [Coemansia spiralis]